jgi:hypothetical protein
MDPENLRELGGGNLISGTPPTEQQSLLTLRRTGDDAWRKAVAPIGNSAAIGCRLESMFMAFAP